MADDKLKIQKANSTEVKSVKPENNKETRTGEIKPAEQLFQMEQEKVETSVIDLSQTAQKKAEQEQEKELAILIDIDVMTKIPLENNENLNLFGQYREILSSDNLSKEEALKKIQEILLQEETKTEQDYQNAQNLYANRQKGTDDSLEKGLMLQLETDKYNINKKHNEMLKHILSQSDKLTKKEIKEILNILLLPLNNEKRQETINFYHHKVKLSKKELNDGINSSIAGKLNNNMQTMWQIQQVLESEGFVSYLTNGLIGILGGTTSHDVQISISDETDKLQDLVNVAKTKDVRAFMQKYKEITGVEFNIENFERLTNAENKYYLAKEAQRELKIAEALEKDNKHNSNFNIACAKTSIGAKNSYNPLHSPLEKALLKLTDNNYAQASEWIRTQTEKLGIENYPQKDKYNTLVEHFIKTAKTNAKITFGDKSIENFQNEYETLIKNAYGNNLSAEKLQNYMKAQATAKSWLQTGVMISCGMFAGPATLASIIGGISLLEKSTDKDGLTSKDIIATGGEIAITYAGFKIFGAVTKSSMNALQKQLTANPTYFDMVVTRLTAQVAGGATAGMFAGTVGAVVAGERDISKILSTGAEGALSGALFALAFGSVVEIKEGLKTPAQKFKDSYKHLLKVIKKEVPGGKEFLKSLDGQEYTEVGFQKVGEFLKNNIPNDIHFSNSDRQVINTHDGIEFVDEIGILVSTQPETTVRTEKAFEYVYTDGTLATGRKMTNGEQELIRAMLNVVSTGRAAMQALNKAQGTKIMPEFVKLEHKPTQETEIQEAKQEVKPTEFSPEQNSSSVKFSANEVVPIRTKAVASETKSDGVKTETSLTTDEKMQLLAKKLNRPLSHEDLQNENLRHNVDLVLAYLEHCPDIGAKGGVIRAFSVHKFNISSECFKSINPGDWNTSVLLRLCRRGYPIELLNLSFNTSKSIKGVDEFVSTLNLGTDKNYGAELIDWYQNTTAKSGELNNAFRLAKQLSDKAKEIMTFFDTHQRPLGKNMGLVRGTTDYPGLEISKLKPGDEFVDKGYASTMHIDGIPQVLDAFPDDFGNFEHFLIIKTPATQKVIVPADWTGTDSMGEVILPRGTKFRVIDNLPLTDYGSRGHEIIEGRRAIIVEIVEDKADTPEPPASEVETIADQKATERLSYLPKDNFVEDNSAFIPEVFEGSQIPMHHDVNGENIAIRTAVEYQNKDIPQTDKNWYKSKIAQGKQAMAEIDEAFKKLPPLEKDCIVYRGRSENPSFKNFNTDFEIIDAAQEGDVIVPDTAYSYAAFHKTLANNWGGPGARGWVDIGEKSPRVMMMELRLPKGAKVSRNLEHGGEVIMPRSAKYKLLSKKADENGDVKVVLEYILPKEVTRTPALKIAGKNEKAECHFVKGYNDGLLSPEYTAPTRHIKHICFSEFNRYPSQTDYIKAMMAEAKSPLKVFNIGVAQGQEPLTHLNSAFELSQKTGKSLSEFIDLTTTDILSEPPALPHKASEFDKKVLDALTQIYDKNSGKSHWGTPIETLIEQMIQNGEKQDVILFNNVLQHMATNNEAELFGYLEKLVKLVNDNGVMCFTVGSHALKPYETERINRMLDLLKTNGFEEVGENSGIFKKTIVINKPTTDKAASLEPPQIKIPVSSVRNINERGTEKAVSYIDKTTGEVKEAKVSFVKSGRYEKVTVRIDDKIVGEAKIEPDALDNYSPPYNFGLPKKLSEMGNCVYVDAMESYQPGVGTILHKAVAQRSIDMGFKGRVCLDAAWASFPFHYTCGFREFGNGIETKDSPWAEQLIEEYRKTGVRKDDDFGAHQMFLTEEKAQELLSAPLPKQIPSNNTIASASIVVTDKTFNRENILKELQEMKEEDGEDRFSKKDIEKMKALSDERLNQYYQLAKIKTPEGKYLLFSAFHFIPLMVEKLSDAQLKCISKFANMKDSTGKILHPARIMRLLNPSPETLDTSKKLLSNPQLELPFSENHFYDYNSRDGILFIVDGDMSGRTYLLRLGNNDEVIIKSVREPEQNDMQTTTEINFREHTKSITVHDVQKNFAKTQTFDKDGKLIEISLEDHFIEDKQRPNADFCGKKLVVGERNDGTKVATLFSKYKRNGDMHYSVIEKRTLTDTYDISTINVTDMEEALFNIRWKQKTDIIVDTTSCYNDFDLPEGKIKFGGFCGGREIRQLDVTARPNPTSERIVYSGRFPDGTPETTIIDYYIDLMIKHNPDKNRIYKSIGTGETDPKTGQPVYIEINMTSSVEKGKIVIADNLSGKNIEFSVEALMSRADETLKSVLEKKSKGSSKKPTDYFEELLRSLPPTTLLSIKSLLDKNPDMILSFTNGDEICYASTDNQKVNKLLLNFNPKTFTHEVLHGVDAMLGLSESKEIFDIYKQELDILGQDISEIAEYGIIGSSGTSVAGLEELIAMTGTAHDTGAWNATDNALRLAFPKTIKLIETKLIEWQQQILSE